VRSAIGIDVGGTRARAFLVAEDGRVLGEELAEMPADDVEASLDTLYRLASDVAEDGRPSAVGIGSAGMVDFDAGVIRFSPNQAWQEVPLRDLVGERTGLPCVLDNDANAAAWGEYRFGAGRGHDDLLLVTVGTGIGGGIVSGGALVRGAHGFAAEIGHIVVEPGGPWCGCGNRGCWEQVASGRALDRAAREAAVSRPDSLIARLAGAQPPEGLHVWEAARRRDRMATSILETVGRRLGEGIGGLVNVLDPSAVVVGGGVADIGDLLLEPAREAYLDTVEAPDHRPAVPILAAALGNRAGGIGAATLALDLAGPGEASSS
jgi:glucokinase